MLNIPEHKRSSRLLMAMGLITFVLFFAVSGNYGIFRDELYYFANGEHLDWGYVDHPPLIGAISAISRFLFGDWLMGLRLPATIAISITVFMAGYLARLLGGGLFAQGLACLVALIAPVYQGMSNYLSMNAFDLLFWACLIGLFIEMVKADAPRHWWAIGGVAGLGLLNKYSVLFLIAAMVMAFVLTRYRRHLMTHYPYIGGATALALLLPNILWQAARGWPFLEFQQQLTETKTAWITLPQFLLEQVLMMHPFSITVWLTGLLALLFWKPLGRYRVLGIAWLIALALYLLKGSKTYYPAPSYLLLIPAGAVFLEHFFEKLSWKWLGKAFIVLLILGGLLVLPYGLPVLPIEAYIAYDEVLGLRGRPTFEDGRAITLQQHYADRFGWEEMVQKVATTYHALSEEEQQKTVIFGNNYGNAGAVDFFRHKYELPSAISTHLSYYFWGPGEREPETYIIAGRSNREDLEELFEEVQQTEYVSHPYAIFYETDYYIHLCRGPKFKLAQFWEERGMSE